MGIGILSSVGRLSSFRDSCFHACAVKVTVVWSVCLLTNLTYGTSVHSENVVTYSAGNESEGICLKRLRYKSYAAKHERKSQYQYANYSDLPAAKLQRLHSA